MAPDSLPALSGLHLSHLRLLIAIYEERSVSAAAERLHLTPSAVSHGLKKLRDKLGDDLFVRRPDGMHPTARTEEIAKDLRAALDLLHQALDVSVFDPTSSRRQFRMACLPYMNMLICPALAQRLSTSSPGIGIEVQQIDFSVLRNLEYGLLDLVIAPIASAPPWSRSQLLVNEPMVFVIRKGHPRGDGPLSLVELANLLHVEIQIANYRASAVPEMALDMDVDWAFEPLDKAVLLSALEAEALTHTTSMTVPDAATALSIVATTDMITLSLSSIAREFGRNHDVVLLDPPYSASPVPMRMIWSARRDRDPAHKWLRQQVADQLRASLPSEG